MSKRNKIIIILCSSIALIIIWFVATFLAYETWTASEMLAIHVVVDNRTNSEIGPFKLADSQGAEPVHIDIITPLSKCDAYFLKPESWGENSIVLIDSDNREYGVVPYFENGQNGRVDIRATCASSVGLAGNTRQLTSWYFSFKWRSWGFSECYTAGQ
jgi:hypothetical protein